MANYDGPTYTIESVGWRAQIPWLGPESNVPLWTAAPSWSMTNFGGAGTGGGGGEEINGYGYSHSG